MKKGRGNQEGQEGRNVVPFAVCDGNEGGVGQ